MLVSLYFWWQNIKGIHESSERALQIMKITTVMVVMLIVWCLLTLAKRGGQLPPLPSPADMHHDRESLGWLLGTWAARIPLVMLLVGFGHSVLAMSGEESLAQVNREIEHPKLKNLEKTGLVIFLYSLFFTSLVSFFAVMIIPDGVRQDYFANLISGLAMNVVGPYTLRLFFQGFVVIVGALILSGAVNTAIVGANGVLSRMVEDGVLTTWFKKPHKRFGTSYRVINMIVGLQIFTIRRQPRQCVPAGFALRLRRDLELLVHVAGGDGVALHQSRRTGSGKCPATFTLRAWKSRLVLA